MKISTPRVRRNGNGVLPLAAIFCFGLLLFAIAATIVIALIPVYLSNRDEEQVQFIQSPPQQITYNLPTGTTYPTGSLTQAQRDVLVQQYQTMINNNPTTAGSTLGSSSATVSSSVAKKRKRQATIIIQFLTVIYEIVFRPDTMSRRRIRIIAIINEILRVPLSNYDFLLNSGSPSQGTGSSATTIASATTIPSTTTLASSTNSTATTIAAATTSSTGQGSSGAVVTSYTPVPTTCPNGPFVFSSDALYPDEASWLQQRVPVAEASLRTWLAGIGLNANDYNATTVLPRIALATSGGGYRSLLTGAGVIQAFDGREQTTKTLFSGLLQGITYQTGTSGGAWLVTSFAANNYPTISSLRDSLWIQRFQFFVATPNPAQPDYSVVATAQIVGKKKAGFKVTAADVWSRDLAFQLIQSPNGGPNVTYDQITSTDAFKSFSLPFPIVTTIQFDPGMCVPSLNSSLYEFTPYAFGSWDVGIRAFTPIKYLGTRYTNGQIPANGQCVIGYDNAGFVLGTSSFLFNEIECRVLPDGSLAVDDDSQNTTFGIITKINTVIRDVINAQEGVTTEDLLSANYPNPFQGSAQSPKVSSLSDLNFVDGGETDQNIPLSPLIQPVRKVDLIFANDNSADVDNFPNGTQIMNTYTQSLLFGLPFPFIPDANTFVSQGLNVRPTFFGCNETNVPLVIYLPNTNISFASGIPTFKPTYSEDETRGLILNGLNIATQSNSTQWARCVACAIARRIGGLYGANTSAECRSCFDTYCFKRS